ncbi:MAG: dipicolinate synthase subunit B [Firmicutes bacterium]|nr:dipicolinate synthase subunit B [Bacillota bacterium]
MTVGFAVTGSFCTFSKVFPAMEALAREYTLVPIFSPAAAETDTRFGSAQAQLRRASAICGTPPILTIADAEPIGPKKMLDALVVAPCTGNSLAKISRGIADTCVTMAVKSHLRNGRPVVIAVSTNDGLAAAGENLARLLNRKNFYFVPFGQDDPLQKPTSLVADFSLLPQTVSAALAGQQLQPILL